MALVTSASYAGDNYPARPYLEENLARAAQQFPDDSRMQRCWAATETVWQYTMDTYGPDKAQAWLKPWWFGGNWRKICDGQGLRTMESRHWGITCPYMTCPEGQGPYISVNHDLIYSANLPESWLHARYFYVMTHEMAHAIGYFYGDPMWSSDHWADAVAKALGASVCPHSPYCGNGPPYPKFQQSRSPGTPILPPKAPIQR